MTDTEDFNEYLGMIGNIKGEEVDVSLWGFRQGKIANLEKGIFAMIPRKYFPRGELEIGQTFKYYPIDSGIVEMIKPEEVSPEEMDKMKKDLDREMQGLPDEYT